MSRLPLGPLSGNNLGDYLREQRQSARLSLRQLSELAGVSNPYLSQIERGLKRPSAEILQQLAKGLEVSAESLYVRAGILDERHGDPHGPHAAALDTRGAIDADPELTARQKAALIDIYDSFVGAKEKTVRRRATRSRATATSTRTAEATDTKATDTNATKARATKAMASTTKTTKTPRK